MNHRGTREVGQVIAAIRDQASASEVIRKITWYLRGLVRIGFDRQGPWACGPGVRTIRRHGGRIRVGRRSVLWPRVKLSAVSADASEPASIEIGDATSIGDRTEIHAGRSVTIGSRVMMSWDCVVLDRNYHSIGDEPERVMPVKIEDDVWIGCRVIILPGVTIGRGAIVGAGSVVTRSVAPGEVVAGNPAKPIRRKQP